VTNPVAGLLPHLQQAIAGNEALAELMINLWWWRSAWWLLFGGKLGQDVGIQGIGLSPTGERASVVGVWQRFVLFGATDHNDRIFSL